MPWYAPTRLPLVPQLLGLPITLSNVHLLAALRCYVHLHRHNLKALGHPHEVQSPSTLDGTMGTMDLDYISYRDTDALYIQHTGPD
jgi:hypothetical protein